MDGRVVMALAPSSQLGAFWLSPNILCVLIAVFSIVLLDKPVANVQKCFLIMLDNNREHKHNNHFNHTVHWWFVATRVFGI